MGQGPSGIGVFIGERRRESDVSRFYGLLWGEGFFSFCFFLSVLSKANSGFYDSLEQRKAETGRKDKVRETEHLRPLNPLSSKHLVC